MERVIKFRFYILTEKRMIDAIGFCFETPTQIRVWYKKGELISNESFALHNVIIMQLVGIKNEHGFSVYEGDIIYSDQWNPTTYQVCFDRGAFYIAGKGEEEVADIKYAEQFKVIGNVHEHPHLIK